MMPRRRVILESPSAHPTPEGRSERLLYLRAALRDSLDRGEAPFASHAIYPGVLDDDVPADRALGMEAGFAWREAAAATVVYLDLGLSPGVLAGIAHATAIGHPIEYRRLGPGSRCVAVENREE